MKGNVRSSQSVIKSVRQVNAQTQLQWVKQAKAGDQNAFNRLAEHYQHAIFKTSYQFLRNREAAHDATQETLLRAYCKLDTYQDDRSFATWLFAIARNYCLDQLKKSRPHLVGWDEVPERFQAAPQKMSQPEAIIIASETNLTLRRLVRALPPDYAQVLHRRYWQMESCRDIAESLDTTVGTVKGRLFRARQRMRTQIGDQTREPG